MARRRGRRAGVVAGAAVQAIVAVVAEQLIVLAFADAERLHRQALGIRMARFGPRHVEIAFTLGSLAQVLSVRGQHNQALVVARQALKTFHAACGPRHPHTRASARNLARLERVA